MRSLRDRDAMCATAKRLGTGPGRLGLQWPLLIALTVSRGDNGTSLAGSSGESKQLLHRMVLEKGPNARKELNKYSLLLSGQFAFPSVPVENVRRIFKIENKTPV